MNGKSDLEQLSRISFPNNVLLAVCILLIFSSWIGVASLRRGLNVKISKREETPLRLILPKGRNNLPGVVVAHGFGGSQQLMLGYGYALARAGYGVMLLDFSGHAANARPLNRSGERLIEDVEVAANTLSAQPEIAEEKIALLGHSMGSGAVMSASIKSPERYAAVVAISPTDASVSREVPPNLLLQAGSLEVRFAQNALDLLDRAGGANDNFDEGNARRFDKIPGVEHISILFSWESKRGAITWLDSVYERKSPSLGPDLRIFWYGLHLISWIGLVMVLKPRIIAIQHSYSYPHLRMRHWVATLLVPFIATALLGYLPKLAEAGNLLGMLIGGTLALWFLLLGTLSILISVRVGRPSPANLSWGLVFFATLWIVLGLMAQYTWMQWFLIPERVWRWIVIAIAVFPWKLASGFHLAALDGWKRVGYWSVSSFSIVASLAAFAVILPSMFVVILIAPIIPIVLGVDIWVGNAFRSPWSYAIGSALFFSWMIAAFFPLG